MTEVPALADAPKVQHASALHTAETLRFPAARPSHVLSLRRCGRIMLMHWRLLAAILGTVLALCLVYCLLAPKQYEARTQLALRAAPVSALSLDSADAGRTAAFASGETQLETLAGIFRGDQLAWRVIVDQKLYQAPGFAGRFADQFPDFRLASPAPAAQAYLLERFHDALSVRTVPRTLLLEMRFQSGDPVLSADALNGVIRALQEQQSETRIFATAQATGWLNGQLKELKAKADRDEQQLAAFQKTHGLLIAPEARGNEPGSAQHGSALLQVDELGRELVAASADRIQCEAEFRAASQGDPELVLASDPHLQGETGALSVAAFRQLHQRRSELEQEQAQLAIEHGPNFPRALEIRQATDDLDRQLQAEDGKLRDRFRSAWQTAVGREQMIRKSLAELTGEGQQLIAAAGQYDAMRREADASHELYVRMQGKVEEAGLAAGVDSANFWVVDAAHTPAKAAWPNLSLILAIGLFAGFWLATAIVFLAESFRPSQAREMAAALAMLAAALAIHAQAPTPSTSGLPTGVVKLPATKDTKNLPNPKEAPPIWNAAPAASTGTMNPAPPITGPILSGELLDITEFHTPEFHSAVRVSAAGTVTLPMIGEMTLNGLDEVAAARAIEAALVEKGMLLHPQVNVLVTSYVGQDVTILGEVARPGVYPYGAHHRLLDVISAASGLNATAGGLVSIAHRGEPGAPHMVALDFSQAGGLQQNPELLPGDMVRVSRAGLVYVVGDVNRPGGFTLDPVQPTTVLQALSLAWGPSQNASLSKALLIHERDDGRTVTSLDLKRMLRGQDPDIPVGERDILFVPDSTAKNLWNRTMESVVQSAVGVSIYAGMVYSQRF